MSLGVDRRPKLARGIGQAMQGAGGAAGRAGVAAQSASAP
jgi:hypothetical protein